MLELRDHVAQVKPGHRTAATRNKGRRCPADPPRVGEIVAVMRQARTDLYGRRLRGLIIVLWRAGLRISDAISLTESDLEVTRGSVLVAPAASRPCSGDGQGRCPAQRFIQRQVGHANLGVTSIYLQGIDSGEIIETVRSRRPPVIPGGAALAG